jgi:hypothetical protein
VDLLLTLFASVATSQFAKGWNLNGFGLQKERNRPFAYSNKKTSFEPFPHGLGFEVSEFIF